MALFMRRLQNKILLCMAGFVMSLLFAECVTDKDEPGSGLGVGDAIPYFSIVMNDGSTLTSYDLLGREAVICFFNTECPDCQRELPMLQTEYDKSLATPGSNMIYVCISREEDAESVDKYWREHSLTLPWSAQTDRSIYNLFADTGIPRVYRISPDGRIIFVEKGRQTYPLNH
ncbi:MAG: TlpA family protein disulfide reductase [Candidatus Amulumruptor caecigallinarius]|nr:TlpA family protein disulfide reductase [Candidatus Amulumruptor caecigallinarius]